MRAYQCISLLEGSRRQADCVAQAILRSFETHNMGLTTWGRWMFAPGRYDGDEREPIDPEGKIGVCIVQYIYSDSGLSSQ